MSAEATGWVYRHSPYSGAGFSIHLAIGDSVNDQHGNEFWMAAANLARKARVSRSTVTTAIAALVSDGYIERLDEPGAAARAGRPARYRFLFPETTVAFETRRVTGERSGGVTGERPPPARPPARGVTGERALTQETTQGEPKVAGGAGDKARARTPRDDLFDALVAAFGPASTPSRASFYGKAVNELATAGATPQQVQRARIAMSRRGWDSPTPEAMLKHWDALLTDTAPANPASARFWETN